MASQSKNKKQRPKCPPIPEGFTHKFTGPAYENGMSHERAKVLWEAFRSSVDRLVPMPRTTHK